MKTATIAAVMLAVTVPAAWGQFGDGTYLVGVDVEPGIYRAPGGSFCTWERLSGLGGEFDDIISMDFSENSSQIVEIKTSDMAFKVSGCGTWELADGGGGMFTLDVVVMLVYAITTGVMEAVEPDAALIDQIESAALEAFTSMAPGLSYSEERSAKGLINSTIETMRGYE